MRKELKAAIIRTFRFTHHRTVDSLAKRAAFVECIARHAENGLVAMVWGSRDCDQYEVNNCVTVLPATRVACDQWVQGMYEDAEGPFWFHCEKPSEAEKLQRDSRDHVMEAFEDGHPHTVYV